MHLSDCQGGGLQIAGTLCDPCSVRAKRGVLLLLVLGCLGVAESAAQSPPLEITATPSLAPAFEPGVPDYVARCRGGRGVQLAVSAPAGDAVSVDDGRFRGGSFRTSVRVLTGQAFRFVIRTAGGDRHYVVRCLPPGFPAYVARRPGRPQAAWYVVAPCCHIPYAAIFDNYGVPVWWLRTRHFVLDAALLPDGGVAVALNRGKHLTSGESLATFNEYHLDGAFERTFSIPGGVPTDRHELQILRNGDYVVVAHVPRTGVDLRHYGGPANATVLDAVIAEVSPQGKLVWSWDSKDHIRLAETGRWYQGLVLSHPVGLSHGRRAYDIVHINAVEPYGHGFLASFRHADAIYAIDKASGKIEWKLGGTHTRQSLKILGDGVPDFGGQHDVRVLPDGTVTLFDNGTGRGRSPRALRFRIDARAHTATRLEQLIGTQIQVSPCCGSARKLPGGDWVVSWGGTHLISELTPTDQPVFQLEFPLSTSYRAQPLLPGQVSRAALNAGMDSTYPRRAGGGV